MSQILMEELENARIGVLSGPNLAREIVAKALTATVIASNDEDLCQIVQSVLHCDYFRGCIPIRMFMVSSWQAL